MARAPAYVITCSVPLDAPCDLLLAVVTGTKYLTRSLCVGHRDPSTILPQHKALPDQAPDNPYTGLTDRSIMDNASVEGPHLALVS